MSASEHANIVRLIHIAIATESESKRQRMIARITWRLAKSPDFSAKVVLS